MSWIKPRSLESYLKVSFIFISLPSLAVATWFLWPMQWGWIGILGLALLGYWVANRTYDDILKVFARTSLQLEALHQQDYNQRSKPVFKSGQVGDVHNQLQLLSEQLLQDKARYDQHAFLIYHLIGQLNSPVLVFNAKQKLSFGNEAFAQLFGQNWQYFRHAAPHLLGLEHSEQGWRFSDKQKNQQWQCRESVFVDGGERHELLIFVNIAPALRQSQMQAWQQLIRVLSHEIRNSLTPVSSLAESLHAKLEQPRQQQALEVISERCQHLQTFVERYAAICKPLKLQIQRLNLEEMLLKLQALYSELTFEFDLRNREINVDSAFFEQVLINIVKNAKEAGATALKIQALDRGDAIELRFTDNGHGIANADNLLVPLYSTKPEGQGLGLSLCRHIIEQHGGKFSLANAETDGAEVIIRLPF